MCKTMYLDSLVKKKINLYSKKAFWYKKFLKINFVIIDF